MAISPSKHTEAPNVTEPWFFQQAAVWCLKLSVYILDLHIWYIYIPGKYQDKFGNQSIVRLALGHVVWSGYNDDDNIAEWNCFEFMCSASAGFNFFVFCYGVKKKKVSLNTCMGSWQIIQVEISAQCLCFEGEELSLCCCPPCVENSKRCSSRLNLL